MVSSRKVRQHDSCKTKSKLTSMTSQSQSNPQQLCTSSQARQFSWLVLARACISYCLMTASLCPVLLEESKRLRRGRSLCPFHESSTRQDKREGQRDCQPSPATMTHTEFAGLSLFPIDRNRYFTLPVLIRSISRKYY